MLRRTEDGEILLLGIKLGSLIGLIGFAMAIAANAWLLLNHFTGAEVRMYAPEQVELRCGRTERRDISDQQGKITKRRFCKNSGQLTVIASSLAYSNEGANEYHAIVMSEIVDVEFLGGDEAPEAIRLHWQWFTDISNVNIEKTVAVPTLVKGGESLAHEVQFTSRYYSGRPSGEMLWSDFIAALLSGSVQRINLIFSAEVLGDEGPFAVACMLIVDDRAKTLFQEMGMDRFQHTFSCES